MSEFTDVRDFHLKFNQIVNFYPHHLTTRKLKERAEFQLEEFKEFLKGAGLELYQSVDGEIKVGVGPNKTQDMAEMADALVDQVYVALGTVVMMGLPWKDLWDDVQRANMAKVPGTTHRGHRVDVCKPPGWVPPHTEEILASVGYKAEIHADEAQHVDDPIYVAPVQLEMFDK